jgi:predicted GNAT family acetyltransferase
MDNLIIRKMQLNDYTSMHKNIFDKMNIEDVKTNVTNNVISMGNEDNDWDYFVADYNNEVVGITYINYSKKSVNMHIAELVSVVTTQQYRKMGIFKFIFNYLLRYLKEKGIEKIILTVRKGVDAELVYQKIGFTKYGELPKGIKEDNKYIDQVHYYYDIK